MIAFLTRRCAQLGLAATFVVLSASVAVLLAVPRYSHRVQVADLGTVAPDFELPDINGGIVALSSLRGQAVVLFFSSLQNPLSSQYNDRVERLAQSYETDARVKFFAINVGNGEALDPFLIRLDDRVARRTYPTLLDDKAAGGPRGFSATQTPMMIIVSPQGVVRYRGPFDSNPDLAFASQAFLADALHDVLESSTVTVASK